MALYLQLKHSVETLVLEIIVQNVFPDFSVEAAVSPFSLFSTASSFLHRRRRRFQHYVANSDKNKLQSFSLTLEFNIDPLLPPGGLPCHCQPDELHRANSAALHKKNFLFLSFRPAEVQKSQSANIQIHLKSQILLSKK